MSSKISFKGVDTREVDTLNARYRDYQWHKYSLLLAIEEHYRTHKRMRASLYDALYLAGKADVPYSVMRNLHTRVLRVANKRKISREEACKYIVFEQYKVKNEDGRFYF